MVVVYPRPNRPFDVGGSRYWIEILERSDGRYFRLEAGFLALESILITIPNRETIYTPYVGTLDTLGLHINMEVERGPLWDYYPLTRALYGSFRP